MGVPGFFAWIHKNYKKKNMITNVNKDLEVANLFIDTNCLIHPQCFAILAANKELKNIDRLENKMINQVIIYLNEIIETVDPSKLIYIAIDGVAPMAKMFHQRGRRFKSVRDSEVKNSIRKKCGMEEEKLWSNACITPGTLFMEKLSKAIINYINFTKAERIKKGLKADRVIMYSSSNTPGEGEHKVLQYIRQTPDLEGNSVVYGLDADLLFLSLASQRNNIYLIRESQELGKEVNGGAGAGGGVVNSKFKYVSIDILRECIIQEIIYRVADEGDEAMEKKIISNGNNFVNDFIFSCFLLGNDFVPNIVSLSLKTQNNKIENGLDVLFEKYGDVFASINKGVEKFKFLVNDDCSINYKFFNEFCSTLAILERSFLQQVNDYKRHFRHPPADASDFEVAIFRQENLMFKIDDPVMLGKDDGDKQRYYKHYYNIEIGSEKEEENKVGKEFINKMVNDYLYGLFWINNYYMKDCIDWSWCFPNHHGLFMSDLSESISKMKEDDFNKLFVKGDSNNYNKIKPFEQLMMVLPIQLAYLLPEPLKTIMKTDPTIRKFGPKIFEQDMLYKTQLWQCIPMIDMIPLEHVQGLVAGATLKGEDEKRNKTMKVYVNQC
jgi:5'-3' exonuclease